MSIMNIRSETTKSVAHLRSARKAILGRGGEISATAGLKDLPEAIFNIPADASLAYYEDSEVAYQKTVPANVNPYAMIKEIGGLTRKCTNLIPFPYSERSATRRGLTMTVNDDGSLSVKGTPDGTGAVFFYFVHEATNSRKPIKAGTYTFGLSSPIETSNVKLSLGVSGVMEYDVYGNNSRTVTVANDTTFYIVLKIMASYTEEINATFYPMLNKGDTALPYEPFFEGLRSTPVTELVSEGANLIPFPYSDGDVGATKSSNGATWTVNNDRSITVRGTPTGFTSFNFATKAALPQKTFTISVTSTNASNIGITLILSDENDETVSSITKYLDSITINPDDFPTAIKYRLYAHQRTVGVEIYGTIIMMLNEGDTALPYSPNFKDTFQIPEAIQALRGYGLGMSETVYNYIDLLEKLFVEMVYAFKFLGNETVQKHGQNNVGAYIYSMEASANFSRRLTPDTVDFRYVGHIGGSAIALNSDEPAGAMWVYEYSVDQDFNRIYFASEKATVGEFLQSVVGKTIIFGLYSPIITDISHLLTSDMFLNVVPRGSITPVNEYEYAVPTTIKYVRKV